MRPAFNLKSLHPTGGRTRAHDLQPVVMTMSFMTVIVMSVVTVIIVCPCDRDHRGEPWAIAMLVLMTVSMVVFVGMPLVVAMSFPVIVPVNAPQVIFALGLVIMVVPVL